jgi:hypothetical protein
MYGWAVITFTVILKNQLPIGVHFVTKFFRNSQIGETPRLSMLLQRPKKLRQRWSNILQANKNKTVPTVAFDRNQIVLSGSKALDVIHVGRAHQFSIPSVGPCVVWTLNAFPDRATVFVSHQFAAAMPAKIAKTANRTILVTDQKQTVSVDRNASTFR